MEASHSAMEHSWKLLFVLGLSLAVSASEDDSFAIAARTLEKCSNWPDMNSCLKTKVVSLLDRALRTGPLPIGDYVTMVPDPSDPVTRSGRALSENEIEAALPQDADARDKALDDMMNEKMTKLVESRKFELSSPEEVEGRRKKYKEKGGAIGMMMGMLFLYAVKAAMAKIGLIAGMALIAGKLALLLSSIIGLKKLVSGGGESHQVVYAEPHGSGGWGRSATAHPVAHDLAYAAQARAHRK